MKSCDPRRVCGVHVCALVCVCMRVLVGHFDLSHSPIAIPTQPHDSLSLDHLHTDAASPPGSATLSVSMSHLCLA